jgi:hypothetical protein
MSSSPRRDKLLQGFEKPLMVSKVPHMAVARSGAAIGHLEIENEIIAFLRSGFELCRSFLECLG